ncbi:MAG TPA: hypothetical protein VFP12_05735 [Allosphingosinicella sp.]|nr:hypothetical protein [Allosphingosinicella sp.]
MDPWLLAPAGAVLLLVLALKLRGPGGSRDLTGPPKRRRRITAAEARRLAELVGRGEAGEAQRLIRQAGVDEAEAERLVALVARLEGAAEADEEG